MSTATMQLSFPVTVNGAFCVYSHSHRGKVFYVGKGRPERPWSASDRSPLWQAFVRSISNYDVTVLAWFDDEAAASKEEEARIRALQPLCNIKGKWLRPPQNRSASYTMISARLPTPFLEVVKLCASQQHRSLSDLVREGLEWRITHHGMEGETLAEAASSYPVHLCPGKET